MLRFDNKIRLTAEEQKTICAVAGTKVDPKTVTEYNAILGRAKSDLESIAADVEPELDAEGVDQSGHAEARLLAAFAGGLAIES